jgi:hypothetical protein
MPFDFQRSRRPGGSTLDTSGPIGAAPGKQTLVQATRFPPGAIQRKAGPDAPIQRQDDGRQPDPLPPPPIGSPVVYQYGAGSTDGRANDCGPACVWMVIRMMGYEAQLDAYIVAHRPDSTTYRQIYFGNPDATPPPAPTLQERMDLARRCGNGEDVSTMPALATSDAPMFMTRPSKVDEGVSPANLRASLANLLQLLGVTLTDAELTQLLPVMSDNPDDALYPSEVESDPERTPAQRAGNAQLLAYIRANVAGDSAVILLGQPSAGTAANPVDTAWGWGGDVAQEQGAHTISSARGGHFVIVDDFDTRTGLYTVFDPSYNQPRQVPGLQLIAFVDAYTAGASVNVMPIPTATLRELVADAQAQAAGDAAQPKRAAAAPAATAPAPSGPGAPLPAPTLDKMQRAFTADFTGVRVHVDGAAAAVGALAFARGDDLHFAPGQYRPGTPDGDALIGHELAHVVQQRAGRVSGDGVVEDAGLESEADREGARAAALADLATAAVTFPAPAGGASTAGATPTTATAAPLQKQDNPDATPAGSGGPALTIPPGPIPEPLLRAALGNPARARTVAWWVSRNLYDRDQLRAFWAAPANAETRGAVLGELAVRAAKLELMLGWISVGGLDLHSARGFETTDGANHSAIADGATGDTSTNRGPMPNRYTAGYDGGAGMAGWDWCGMFVGYLYGEILGLDNPGVGSAGMEGWRGGDTVKRGISHKIYPERNVVEGDAGFGTFLRWSEPPRPGDIAVISHQEFVAPGGNGAADARSQDHVALVEQVLDDRIRTVDGNVAINPMRSGTGGAQPNAVAGRGYMLGANYRDQPGSVSFYNQSRILFLGRMTDRASNFAAPDPDAGVVAPTAAALLAHADAANAQAQAVLNAMPATPTEHPFDATQPVYSWMVAESQR